MPLWNRGLLLCSPIRKLTVDTLNKWLSAGASPRCHHWGVRRHRRLWRGATDPQAVAADRLGRLGAKVASDIGRRQICEAGRRHSKPRSRLSPSLARRRQQEWEIPDLDVEQYISVFEDIGYLVEDNLIISGMAYNEFSYDVEKAWCNADVQRAVADARRTDKSSTRQTDPIYGQFEKLARSYLTSEGETCKQLDNQ